MITKGAHVTIKDNHGRTALWWATNVLLPPLVEYHHFEDVNIIVTLLLPTEQQNIPTVLNEKDNDGKTALMYAVEKNLLDIFRVLCERLADDHHHLDRLRKFMDESLQLRSIAQKQWERGTDSYEIHQILQRIEKIHGVQKLEELQQKHPKLLDPLTFEWLKHSPVVFTGKNQRR